MVAATPRKEATKLDDLVLSDRVAIMLGTEEAGLSDEALAAVDECVCIPMQGFTESFNVSVCAALMLYQITTGMQSDGVEDFGLSSEEKQELRLRWYRSSIKRAHLLEERYLEQRKE